jgi:hypothetical protein
MNLKLYDVLLGGSSLVQVNGQTECFTFVPMEASMPAVVILSFSSGTRWRTAIMFDLTGLLSGISPGCSNFSFAVGER